MKNVASVEKAFDLLEFLASAARPASLQEATAATHLPKPTAYRLLQSLQNLGYVSRSHMGRDYVIGPRVTRLTAYDPFSVIKAAAKPLLQRLNDELNETVNLGVLSGIEVLYLDYLETTRPLRFIVTPGKSDPYFCTALGRAIAGAMEAAELEALLARTDLEKRTHHSTGSLADIRGKIFDAQRLGYAEESQEAAEGVSCIAVSLAFIGFREAAISVALPTSRLTPSRRSEILQLLKSLTTLSIDRT